MMGHSDLDMSGLLVLPGDFPYQQLLEVSELLRQADVFVPGYPPPGDDLYDVNEFIRDAFIEGIQTTLLPDRNVVSRIAQLARGGTANQHHQLAAGIAGFAQCLDINIETSIAFHELAPSQGNGSAVEELSWFYGADDSHPAQWLHVALGAESCVTGIQPKPVNRSLDLARPLARWRRNYIAALKIAELELSTMNALDRVLSLFDWMYRDFILAGPAAVFACIYLAPLSAPRKRLMKSLRSADREKALQGVQNAAWDITHISDFIRRVNHSVGTDHRFLFSTFDRGLHEITATLMRASDDAQVPEDALAKQLSKWWPERQAEFIAESLYEHYRRGRDPSWLAGHRDQPNYICELIEKGERALRAWSGG